MVETHFCSNVSGSISVCCLFVFCLFVCLFVSHFFLLPLPIVLLIGCLFLPVRWSPTSVAKCLVPSLCWSAPSPSWGRWFTLWNQSKKLNWRIKGKTDKTVLLSFVLISTVFFHPSWIIHIHYASVMFDCWISKWLFK